MNFKKIADQIVIRANEHGLGAYIWHNSETSNSVYIRFKDSRMGSIRISDHKGKSKYKYKFNMRSDVRQAQLNKGDGFWRWFFPINDIDGLMEQLLKRMEISKNWEKKYEYGIPAHKRVPTIGTVHTNNK